MPFYSAKNAVPQVNVSGMEEDLALGGINRWANCLYPFFWVFTQVSLV